jgi:hypothetical protein
MVAAIASAECKPPQFRQANSSAPGITVSLDRRDLTLDNLVCLAQRLKKEFGDSRGYLYLSVFDSPRAAEDFRFSPMIEVSAANRGSYAHLRASYLFDSEKGQEHLYIHPQGFAGALFDYDSTIDLPAAAQPHCRFELSGRCLLKFDEMPDPEPSPTIRLTGAVTLTGRVSRDGDMTHIRVDSAEASPADRKDRLVRAAIANLKTWWVEPASREDTFRITFASGIDAFFPERGPFDLRIDMPNQIWITADASK